MALLKDMHPTIAEILSGDHDAILHGFEQAVAHRRRSVKAESGIRVGARIRMTAAAKGLQGREGVVARVSQKSITVRLDCSTCGKHDPMPESTPLGDRCEDCLGCPDEWRVGAACVEAVAAKAAR